MPSDHNTTRIFEGPREKNFQKKKKLAGEDPLDPLLVVFLQDMPSTNEETGGWGLWGEPGGERRAGQAGGLRMAWGEILMLFLNPS